MVNLMQVCVVHKGRPVAGIINEVFSKDEAAVWGVTLEGEDGFKVPPTWLWVSGFIMGRGHFFLLCLTEILSLYISDLAYLPPTDPHNRPSTACKARGPTRRRPRGVSSSRGRTLGRARTW